MAGRIGKVRLDNGTMGERGRGRRTLLVALVLALALVADLVIILWVTDRPLGLQPANLADGPRLATSSEASPVLEETISGGDSRAIVPDLVWERTVSDGSSKYDVLAFGYREGRLYLMVRLYESMDFSLRKGWGPAFLLIDDKGKKYPFDSRCFPNAVNLHDMFVDLPDDLYCRQTVLEGGYRDLVLVFPQFPASRVPASLRVVEAFQGGNPANPGIIYEEEKIQRTGQKELREAVMAMSPADKGYNESEARELPGLPGTTIQVKRVVIAPSHLVHIFLEVHTEPARSLALLDAVLVGPDGHNYNRLELEKNPVIRVSGGDSSRFTLVFEKLPASVEISHCQLWLHFAVEEGARLPVTLTL